MDNPSLIDIYAGPLGAIKPLVTVARLETRTRDLPGAMCRNSVVQYTLPLIIASPIEECRVEMQFCRQLEQDVNLLRQRCTQATFVH